MDDNDLAVRVTGLQKRYGAKRAVDGLDLTVARGEIVAVLGPNGAGKTTTVEILEGYRRRDGGDVRVLGQDPQTAGRDWRARIGIVLQSSNDLAEATVSELVHHFARYYPDPRDPEEVIDAVALGIVGRPELLFLDEPTTGFDPEARHAFWDLIAGLRDGGTTIVLTTHYLEEAEHLADRVAVVRAGHVVAVDTPADLGGRSARRAVVQWTEGGEVRREQTDAPTAVVAALGARLGGEVPGLQVVRPTLEDVYLGLIADDEDTTPAGEPALATTEAAR
jgi:ABC-2 type transport system ATP-binding protein